ncbi:hypothetical protein J4E83_008824 [Alternaria metachromatica]|uniref:uncharacterized protein n=1 Tax=Alternaria metachromatica TaxID=283354 RepID=UPI0020C1DF83|nr:uncharacterized protein J4E83_008824 [Alternaria metachromatica]KAI4609182.1 hypothetical protein J4E83_008824 [Alternaria metachromatica]
MSGRELLLRLFQPSKKPAIYEHQPLSRSLDEIRLLRLRKDKNGPVHCETKVIPLEQAPEYIALSYRWGPPSPLHDIFIGDQTLKIRDILNSCLLELREELDTWLWIDQICIAQADTSERNHQVMMMSRIYSNSASVIIWLGDVPLAPSWKTDRFNDQDLDGASVKVLLGNVYFTRLWIVQEVMLARNVRLHLNGNRRVDWSTLRDAYFNAVWELQESAPIPIASMYLVSYTRRYTRRGRAMRRQMIWPQCIDGFSANACEDPRDKVYGMMGIMKEEEQLTVDYDKSVLEVYLDVVNILRISMGKASPHVMRNYLCVLGSQMGMPLSLAKSIQPLFYGRATTWSWEPVSPVDPKTAKFPQEQGGWWYEWLGEDCRYPGLPNTRIPSVPSFTPAQLLLPRPRVSKDWKSCHTRGSDGDQCRDDSWHLWKQGIASETRDDHFE